MLWDVESGARKVRLGMNSVVYSVAFSPDGRTLASGDTDKTVALWDVESGAVKVRLRGHSAVYSVAFSPDGRTLASGGADGTVVLWDGAPDIPRIDFDDDGVVGFPDFLLFASQFGLTRSDPGYEVRFDLDGDGIVGFGDFLLFAAQFGS